MKNQKIFIVDDDIDDVFMLTETVAEILENNVAITTAANGVEAMALLKTGYKPTIIFLDVNMPLKTGLECLAEMQQNGFSCPVIIYSTSDNPRDIKDAYDYGAFLYIVKPVKYATQTSILRKAFQLLQGERPSKEAFLLTETSLVQSNQLING